MNGIVDGMGVNKYGKRFGYIVSECVDEYYFVCDPSYFIYSTDASAIQKGDTISFTPFTKYSDRGPWAKEIRIISSSTSESFAPVGMNSSTNYYLPGYSNASLRSTIKKQYLKPYSGEIDVLDKFSEVLRVSYGNCHDLGHGTMFPFCVLAATELLKQYMGGYEFLLVFSHFDSERWQENSLLAIKEIRKRKEVALRRPMVNFYFLISNAENFKYEIDRVKGGTDSAVIPFSFSEILSCRDKNDLCDLILGRFEEYYYENNMLGEDSAIEEDALLFGDRGKIADAITQRCLENKRSGIFGLRRSGKSSVLKAVLRRLDAQECKYVYIESRTELQYAESWRVALYDIARKIRIETLNTEQGEEETKQQFNTRLNLNSTEEEYIRRPQCFIEDVKLYTRGLPSFVIAIDEIERITYNTATSKIWQDLESYEGFFGALRDCGCALILCGVNSTITEKTTKEFNGKTCDNPMYERIPELSSRTYLPAFTNEQTRKMINTLGRYSNIAFDDVYVDINHAFGGQPYAIRQFCSFVFEQVKHLRQRNQVYQVRKPTFDALFPVFCNSSKGIDLFDTILQHVRIYTDEYELLKKIALSPEKYRHISDREVGLIDHLEKYGLIERDSSTGYITFNIDAVQKHMQKTLTKRPEDMNNDERRHYIQDRVAEIERKLKKHIITYYKMNGGDSAGKAVLKSFIKPNQAAKPTPDFNNCTLSEVFNHNLFIIYFSDLRKIIKNNWRSLGKAFQDYGIKEDRFNICMTDMNAGRTDADHYDPEDMTCPEKWDIDDTVLQKFITAHNTLNGFFDYMNQ